MISPFFTKASNTIYPVLCIALHPSGRNPPVAIVVFQMWVVPEALSSNSPSLSGTTCQDIGLVSASCSHAQHLQQPKSQRIKIQFHSDLMFRWKCYFSVAVSLTCCNNGHPSCLQSSHIKEDLPRGTRGLLLLTSRELKKSRHKCQGQI